MSYTNRIPFILLLLLSTTLLLSSCKTERPNDNASAAPNTEDNVPPNQNELDDDSPSPSTSFYEQKGWQLVFADEFELDSLDDTKWAHEVNCWGGGNNEQQCYVDNANNAFVQDGMLHLKAIREHHTAPIYNPDHAQFNANQQQSQPWTSARLRSVSPMPYIANQEPDFYFKHDWTYGRFEIRAKLPFGQGTWPAIWMLPTDWAFGGWASSGEIDIMEAVNLKADRLIDNAVVPENRIHGTLHFGHEWPNNVQSGVSYDFGDVNHNPSDQFHTYIIEWEQDEIRWYIDDDHYATQTSEGWYTQYQNEQGQWESSGDTDAPFNRPFHLILNLAIGGNWAGNVNETGVDAALMEAQMLIDYVRVYQCKDDPTGKACGSKEPLGAYTLATPQVEPSLPKRGALELFSDTINAAWPAWDCCGNSTPTIVTDNNSVYGNAVEFNIVGNTVVGFSSRSDLGAINGNPLNAVDNVNLEFDLKMTHLPTQGSTDWFLKVENQSANSMVQLPLTRANEAQPVSLSTWQHFTFPISLLAAEGLDISAIDTVLIFPTWGAGDGARFLVDNIRFTTASQEH